MNELKETKNLLKIIKYAQEDGNWFGFSSLCTGDLLLGIIRLPSSRAAAILKELDIDFESLKSKIAFVQKNLTHNESKNKSKNIIEQAKEEARSLGHSHLGSEHLLLALAQDIGCQANIVFKYHSINYVKMMEKI